MVATFLIADTHFGHSGICKFLRDDGTKLRPWNDPSEMDEALMQAWNETVRPEDKVYHLGDVAIPRRGLKNLENLHGRKILIRGNHDTFGIKDYLEYFDDVRGCHYLDKCILTHIPVHPVNLTRYEANIHGHLHYRRIESEEGVIDERYQNVCVEHTNYRPINWEEVRSRIKNLV